jgi:hypothetical protein
MNSIERVAIEWDCLALCHRWAYLMDQGEFEAAIDLFTADGSFLRNGQLLRGHAGILKAYAHRPPVTTMHLVTNFFAIDVTSSSLKSRSYMMPISTFDPAEAVKKFDPSAAFRLLKFEDEFQLTAQGWRFSARVANPIMQSPAWPGAMPKKQTAEATNAQIKDG